MKKSNILGKIGILVLVLVLMISLVVTGCGNKSDETESQTDPEIEENNEEENEEKEDEEKEDETVETSSEEVTLRVVWWGSQERADITTEALELFTEKNPHITFETEFAAWDDYWDKMATYAAANSLPDIFQHDYAKISQYVENDLLTDLTPYVESGQLDLSAVDENAISGGKLEDGFYALSLGTNSFGMLIDPDLIENAGLSLPDDDWTWEDYVEMGKTIYEKTEILSEIPLAADPKFMIEYFARSVGKSMYSEDGKSLGFDDPSIIEDFFELELEMIKDGITASPEELLIEKPIEESDFVLGKDWGGPYWTNFGVVVADAAQRPLKLIGMPLYSKGTSPGLYLKPSMFFCIPETSEHKDQAVQVLDFWTNDVDVNKILKADRGVPISSKVREALAEGVSESIKMTFDYIDELSESPNVGPIDPPEPAAGGEVTALIKEVNEEILFERITPEEGAEKIITRANEILSKQ